VVAEASALARVLDGRVILLHVTQPIGRMTNEAGFLEDYNEINRLNRKAAAAQLSRIEDALENEFIRTDSFHLDGSAASMIIEQALRLPADYIVIGSHGHTVFRDLALGSTTRAVVKRATCPVIVIPARQKKLPGAWRSRVSSATV
jgi:nucleotide-binding universal stress UspA family protein